MSNLAKKEEFAPRENLGRTLVYRPHVKWSYYLLNSVSALLLVVAVGLGALQGYEALMLTGIVVSAALFLEAKFLMKPLAFAKIEVAADRLVLDQLGKRTEVPFDVIGAVKFSHIPYLGGWFKVVLADKKSFTFTVVLERSEYILEAIASYNPQLMAEKSWLAYRRTAIVSDRSWSRIHNSLKKWPNIAFKILALPLIAGTISAAVNVFVIDAPIISAFLSATIVFGFINSPICFIVWWLSELVCLLRDRTNLLKNPNDMMRDLLFETKVKNISTLAHYAIFGAFVIGLITLNLAK